MKNVKNELPRQLPTAQGSAELGEGFYDKAEPKTPGTIDELIAEQNVQAVADPTVFGSLSDDDVDALIAEIHQGRQA